LKALHEDKSFWFGTELRHSTKVRNFWFRTELRHFTKVRNFWFRTGLRHFTKVRIPGPILFINKSIKSDELYIIVNVH
jgi:hypothetical protein